jgi:hypothetical protein
VANFLCPGLPRSAIFRLGANNRIAGAQTFRFAPWSLMLHSDKADNMTGREIA